MSCFRRASLLSSLGNLSVPELLWESFWLSLHLRSTRKDETLLVESICTSGAILYSWSCALLLRSILYKRFRRISSSGDTSLSFKALRSSLIPVRETGTLFDLCCNLCIEV